MQKTNRNGKEQKVGDLMNNISSLTEQTITLVSAAHCNLVTDFALKYTHTQIQKHTNAQIQIHE